MNYSSGIVFINGSAYEVNCRGDHAWIEVWHKHSRKAQIMKLEELEPEVKAALEDHLNKMEENE